MAYVNYRFQSLLEVLSGEMSMSRQENVIVKMVLLGITGHGDFCFFVVLGVFFGLTPVFVFSSLPSCTLGRRST